jgi:hypothetical protein
MAIGGSDGARLAHSLRELRKMPVHGGTINAKRARDGAGVLAAVDQLARVLGLRRRHRRLAAELHATRLRRLQPGAEIRPCLAGAV